VDGIGIVTTACGIADEDPVLSTLVAYGIEHAVDGFILGLAHIDAIDITRRELVDLLDFLCLNGCAHHQGKE
jgi:hypothetical protein